MLAAKSLAGVALRSESEESVANRWWNTQLRGPTLILKPSADITNSPRQGYQWPQGQDQYHLKLGNKHSQQHALAHHSNRLTSHMWKCSKFCLPGRYNAYIFQYNVPVATLCYLRTESVDRTQRTSPVPVRSVNALTKTLTLLREYSLTQMFIVAADVWIKGNRTREFHVELDTCVFPDVSYGCVMLLQNWWS